MARTPKIGFMALCAPSHVSLVDDLGRNFPAVGAAEKARRSLVKRGYQVVDYDDRGLVPDFDGESNQVQRFNKEALVTRIDETRRALEKFKAHDVDVMVLFMTTWMWAGEYVQALRRSDIPIILWAIPSMEGCSMVGLLGMHGTLDELGMAHKMIYGSPEDPETMRDLELYAKAAMVKNVLQRSRYGQFGGKCMDMVPGVLDYNDWMQKFGVESCHIDQHTIVAEAERFGTPAVREVYDKLGDFAEGVPPFDEVMDRALRSYLSLKKILHEHRLDFAGVKCVFDLSDYYISPCLAQSLIGEEGFVSACCCEDKGALTMYMVRQLSDAPIFQADVELVDHKTNSMTMISCGSAPFSLAGGRSGVRLCAKPAIEGGAGGVSVDLMAKPGEVTFARVSRVRGEYVMNIAEAEVIEGQPEKRKECGFPTWPHAFMKLRGDPKRFVQNCRSQYGHICYGSIKDELIAVCELLGIQPQTNT